jgi:hypothetical protein
MNLILFTQYNPEVCREIFRSKRNELSGDLRNLCNDKLGDLYFNVMLLGWHAWLVVWKRDILHNLDNEDEWEEAVWKQCRLDGTSSGSTVLVILKLLVLIQEDLLHLIFLYFPINCNFFKILCLCMFSYAFLVSEYGSRK